MHQSLTALNGKIISGRDNGWPGWRVSFTDTEKSMVVTKEEGVRENEEGKEGQIHGGRRRLDFGW